MVSTHAPNLEIHVVKEDVVVAESNGSRALNSSIRYNTTYDGMRWIALSDGRNGRREVLLIMFVEWLLIVLLTYYLNQVVSSSGVRTKPFIFLQNLRKKQWASLRKKQSFQRQGFKLFVQIEKADVPPQAKDFSVCMAHHEVEIAAG
ncbi:hypothetical protein ACHQM5_017366 [Ranunculus cassubicifolius]